ncbi:hypothetical protein SD70_32155 [Gordoniibacillus kamchatkensis]|uniref:Uncharacterized protein n=2 Tax=Gordoniibacillus kamchatkensis TaxID=1590651 RepID=A0ABR5A3L1_9BACL|nr:hypothetical protein SD70_32155 [Paenibacillus sp. VKM B-2647]
MKRTMDIVYCIQCESLVPIGNAAVAFRTGFYKVDIPLGQCAACMVALVGKQHPDEHYLLSMMA